MQIGKELKKIRLELGLSQTEMVGDIFVNCNNNLNTFV